MSCNLPESLPDLPAALIGRTSWSSNLWQTYTTIRHAYTRAHELLLQEADPIRLNMHRENLSGHIFYLLLQATQS